MEYLAQACGDRSQPWPLNAIRQLHGSQTLRDELAREVNVDAVLEGHNDLGQSEFGDRAKRLQAGQTADGLLDEKGDLPLHFLRTKAGRDGIDLHLHRRCVGESVDIELVKRDPAQGDEAH